MKSSVEIGERSFEIICEKGQEATLQRAAQLLSLEAEQLLSQPKHLSESQVLLMSGLMIAEKQIVNVEKITALKAEIEALHKRITQMEKTAKPEPLRVEVPVIPSDVHDAMAEIAARVESLAEQAEEQNP